jgi:hypothetical protein
MDKPFTLTEKQLQGLKDTLRRLEKKHAENFSLKADSFLKDCERAVDWYLRLKKWPSYGAYRKKLESMLDVFRKASSCLKDISENDEIYGPLKTPGCDPFWPQFFSLKVIARESSNNAAEALWALRPVIEMLEYSLESSSPLKRRGAPVQFSVQLIKSLATLYFQYFEHVPSNYRRGIFEDLCIELLSIAGESRTDLRKAIAAAKKEIESHLAH